MRYVYANVDQLEGSEKVGTKQCVALVQHYAHTPVTAMWKEGPNVLDEVVLPKGTVIATFVDGKYQSLPSGNHAGLFVSKDAAGLWIMDQWKSDSQKPKVSKRYLRKRGFASNGKPLDPSNNADAYSVVE
jgi:hypothetical protein